MWDERMPLAYRDQIVTGDARELAKAIPDESVDLVFCDPVFPDVAAYAWLADWSVRVLRPGGSLLAESGHLYLPQILPVMASSGLEWVTMLAEIYPLAWHRIAKNRTMTGWAPYLWWSKGERGGPWVFDRFHANGPDKTHHKWGDNAGFFALYISLLTGPDGIVADPFAGGGTVPAVCKMLGRHWVAFEIDPATAERARERVANTTPPLPGIDEPEQTEMFAALRAGGPADESAEERG